MTMLLRGPGKLLLHGRTGPPQPMATGRLPSPWPINIGAIEVDALSASPETKLHIDELTFSLWKPAHEIVRLLGAGALEVACLISLGQDRQSSCSQLRYLISQAHLKRQRINSGLGHLTNVCHNRIYWSAQLATTASTTCHLQNLVICRTPVHYTVDRRGQMSVPTTPTKQGQDINRLLRSLNTEYGLTLPVRDAPISPSKIPRHDRRDERIYQKIRYLSFKDPQALQLACSHFKIHAKQQESLWVYKPHAETDTLPSQPSAGFLSHNGAYPKLNDVYKVDTGALEETLLRFLDEAVDGRSLLASRRSESNAGRSTNILAGLALSVL